MADFNAVITNNGDNNNNGLWLGIFIIYET